MIKVRKLNKEEFYLNPSMIEIVEKATDTIVITLINKKRYVVIDTMEELLENMTEYYKIVGLTTPQVIFHSYNFGDESDWGKI
jgi:flagellar protein FlbD